MNIQTFGKNVLFYLVIFFMFNPATVFAQNNPKGSTYDHKNLLPHSPDATALGKFGDIPVGLYTGIPNIAIPLHEVKLKNISVPISLNYHSSGIKVDDIASSVGLGWALDFGGVINQVVNGKSDLFGGWIGTPQNLRRSVSATIQTSFSGPVAASWQDNADYNFLKFSADGQMDTQPDLFSYSIPGKSGKFYIDQDGGVHTIPYQNIKIQINIPSSNGDYFVITDEHGNRYFFGISEATTTYNYNSCVTSVTGNNQPSTSASSYLTRIVTPLNEQIEFAYEKTSYTMTNQISETRYYYSNLGLSDTTYFDYKSPCVTESNSHVAGLRIASIINKASGEKIVFQYGTTPRKDLISNPSNLPGIFGANTLDFVKVYDASNNLVKNYLLAHDYFICNDPTSTNVNDFRLRLLSVQKEGEQPYLFTYNSIPLPRRLSFSQDHWGNYNGAVNNLTLLPNENSPQFNTGANREPDTVMMKAGILTRITYPTGGSSVFSFEGNDRYFTNGIRKTWHTGGVGCAPILNGVRNVTFHVNAGSEGFIANWTTTSDSPDAGHDPNGNNTTITISGPNNYHEIFNGNSNGWIPFSGNGGIGPEKYRLIEGDYTLTATNINNSEDQIATGGVQISWKYPMVDTTSANVLVGGLRVKAITDYPVTGIPKTKYFEYVRATEASVGKSSGIILFEPNYRNNYYEYQPKVIGSVMGSDGQITTYRHIKQANYIAQTSSSMSPLGTMQGGSVVYNNVNVYDNLKSNGYTSNEFSYEGPSFSNARHEPFVPVVHKDWLNGLPVRTTVYKYNTGNGTYFSVSKNRKIYKTLIGDGTSQYNNTGVGINSNESFVRGIKVTYQYPEWSEGGPNVVPDYYKWTQPAVFFIGYYYLQSSWSYLTKEINTVYDANGNNPVSDSTEYFYDNPGHAQLTRTVSTGSDGKVKTRIMTYADDYTSGTGFIDDMKTSHLVAAPIENVSYLTSGGSNKLLGGTITQYMAGGKGLAEKVFMLENPSAKPLSNFKFSSKSLGTLPYGTPVGNYYMDAAYSERVTYGYDAIGNPLQVNQTYGIPITYLWAYNNQHVIAEVKNVTYAGVASALSNAGINIQDLSAEVYLSDTQINNIRGVLTTAFPHALVTTFTHKPLVGITSQTDAKGLVTTYEYDSFNRLKSVKDHNGNIVKQNAYHYQNQ